MLQLEDFETISEINEVVGSTDIEMFDNTRPWVK